MYKPFNDEERALFRDAEKYKTIADLWKEFSLYLIAKKTNYHRYRVIHLTDKITIEARRGRKIGSGPQQRLYGGLVLLKKISWYRKKRRALTIDHSAVVAVHGEGEKPKDFWDKNPVIMGMDLTEWALVEFALSAVKSKREQLDDLKERKQREFTRSIAELGDTSKDTPKDTSKTSRYDLLDI